MISYAPLFKTMSEKGISSYALFKMGFSKATYYSIQQGNSISTNTVNQLCTLLKCPVSDVIEYIDDDEQPYRIFICLYFRTYLISEYSHIINVRGILMISYRPLFTTMRQKNISSYELAKRGFPRSTYYAIKHGKSITTNTVNQLCSILGCGVSDIMMYIED